MTRAAYLRVYMPMEIAGVSGRGYVDPDHPGEEGSIRQSEFGLVTETPDEGFIAEWFGERWTCPRNSQLRVLQGVVAFHNAYQGVGGHLLIPEATARLATEELDRVRRSQPGIRSHILTSAWHVPPRWFLCFSQDEKEVVKVASGLSVRYRTANSSATTRVQRAVNALRRAGFTNAITGNIEELLEWLGGFSAECMVELHYGSVSEMFAESELVMDDSVEEIWESVEALERGDLVEAQQKYVELAGRWSLAMSVGQRS